MSKHKDILIVAAILFTSSVYFYQDPEWNGNSRLDLTRAIVEQGTLHIDAYRSQPNWSTEDTAYFNGHYYSDKAIGSSFLAVPFYFLLYQITNAFNIALNSSLIKHVLTTIVLGSAFAINGTAMYLIARIITQNSWKALFAALSVSFGTMLWPYSAVYYGHVLAAAFLSVAFYLLFSMKFAPETISADKFAWAGLSVGLAFITEYTTALIIVGLGFYALNFLRKQKPVTITHVVAAASLGALLPLAVMFAYNLSTFGTPITFGYAYESSNSFQQGMSQGFMGINRPHLSVLYRITIDPQFGLFWQSPILLLAPMGYFMAFRNSTRRAEVLLSLFAITGFLVMNSGYYLWWGGHAFGPRHLIPALPFFIIPIALLPEGLAPLTLILAVVSTVQMLIPLLGEIQINIEFRPRLNLFHVEGIPFTGFSILYDHGLPLILQKFKAGQQSWTLGNTIGIPYWFSAPLLAVLDSILLRIFHNQYMQEQIGST
jgi:hypothetical protein